MFYLTDEAIDSGIDSISGYIVAQVAAETGRPIDGVLELFLLSEAYALLSDKETGYYWDSMNELIEMFKQELKPRCE